MLRARFDSLLNSAKKPVVIFDLDGTLFNVNSRHMAIIRDLLKDADFRARFPEQCDIISKLGMNDFLYSVESTLHHAGIDRYSEHAANFIRHVENFWFKHFFTDAYVKLDTPYPGAAECARHCHRQGAMLVYLSGRDVPNMSRGTLEALEKNGFPHSGHGVTLMLKPAYGLDDYLFKKQALEAIRTEGQVFATFDNEPANVQLFIDQFPGALNVHFNSQYARELPLSGSSFARIDSFKELGF